MTQPLSTGTLSFDQVFSHRLSNEMLGENIGEVFRYAGISKADIPDEKSETYSLAIEAVKKIRDAMNPRSCYIKFKLNIFNDEISFSDYSIKSHDLSLNLNGCHSVILFSATLGPKVDKLIQKYSRLNPALSVFLQSAGAMFIEEYCDELTKDLLKSEEKNIFTPRFSPGYGDVNLDVQKIFFNVLSCEKNLALFLNDSLIMSPEKSVTAFIGIKNR